MDHLGSVTVPNNLDGTSIVAAASALMLLPENASRLMRLHRLAALGMMRGGDGERPATSGAIRRILKQSAIGGADILMQEDPYSDVLVQSVSFFGGPYLVSPGTGENSVADLEILLDAAFWGGWMAEELQKSVVYLVKGLLTVSDIVLKRAGLKRGTWPVVNAQGNAVEVPGTAKLKELAGATFLSHADLEAHGDWLHMVVDTFALDPGQLSDPCKDDLTDERLYYYPFLRCPGGYRLVLPLDLAITIRFHLLRFVLQADSLSELGSNWRESVFRRFRRLLPSDSVPVELERSEAMDRYLLPIDDKRDIHVVLATDPLVDWDLELWGHYDTQAVLGGLGQLVSPDLRKTYSSAEDLLHLVIVDSPGREAFWGMPNVENADPMLIARSDELEVMLHNEPHGLLGLLLFAQAIDNRPGESISMSILDEYTSYLDHESSFYFSDERPPTFTFFQPADGLDLRQKFAFETDQHGVIPPGTKPSIVQAQRRYPKDAPEIYIIAPSNSYFGYVVELNEKSIFIRLEQKGDYIGVELTLLECVAYWIRECIYLLGVRPRAKVIELTLDVGSPEAWRRVADWSITDQAVQVSPASNGYLVQFSEAFVGLLQESMNRAERELVRALLSRVFEVPAEVLAKELDVVAPLGSKHMITVFNQSRAPEMMSAELPGPHFGHKQVTAQLLDDLGDWLKSSTGGGLAVGELTGGARVAALNLAVKYLFERLESEIASYDRYQLLDYLITQNEALVHHDRFSSRMLKSRLACFGEQSHTVSDLVRDRKKSVAAQRANRFLVEYVAACPPSGERNVGMLDYFRLLAIAEEIIERGTTSDFLHYNLADFQVSILESGRLGVSRDEPVEVAIDNYVSNSGMRSIRNAQKEKNSSNLENFDMQKFLTRSEVAMHAEFGFTLNDLREVCGGLLDLATADKVIRIDRAVAIANIASNRGMPSELVSAVLDMVTLSRRSSFLAIKQDSLPWRFNRDMSYVRRPVVLQGGELVFGFRSLYNLVPFWVDSLLSGRLQAQAKTIEMKQCISEARTQINDAFAHDVSTQLSALGISTMISVKKIGKRRIVDALGQDLGDIDILGAHTASKTIIAVEAKDFEVARTPSELTHEVQKLFAGTAKKKATVELHSRRLDWLREHLGEVIAEFGIEDDAARWRVNGLVITSEPLVSPLVQSSLLPVFPVDDLDSHTLNLGNTRMASRKTKQRSN